MASTTVINLSLMVILSTATRHLVTGIPIDVVNNGRKYTQPPPLQQQQPHIRPPPNHYHQPQQSNPPTDEHRQLHPNQNQFRRHSITTPDIKMTSGNFQHNPAEPYGEGNSRSSSFYHKHEESHQPRSNYFRSQHQHQPPPPEPIEAQDTRHGPQTPFRQNFQHPASSQGDPQPPRTHNLHSEESHINQAPELFESNPYKNILNENPRVADWKLQQADPKYSNPYSHPIHHEKRFQEKVSPSPLPPSAHPPSAPTAAFIVPCSDGKLLIEYDISDNDVTYETTVEVEDGTENNIESNDI